jgi:hypothetical protein
LTLQLQKFFWPKLLSTRDRFGHMRLIEVNQHRTLSFQLQIMF